GGHLRIGISPQVGRHLLNGVSRVARTTRVPRCGGRREPKQAVDVHRVGSGPRGPRGPRPTNQCACRVPRVLVARAPGEVPHVGGREVPGRGAAARGEDAPGRRTRREHPYHATRAPRRGETVPPYRAQDRGSVLERARGNDYPTARHLQAQVVVRRLHVELRLEQIRVGDPSVHVVVHRDLRIPVAHEIHVVLVAFTAIGRGRR